jgi:hypothetical protein
MPDIFLITSVINTGSAGWSYTNTRSTFSPQERLVHTLKTIETIRALPSHPTIVFVEGSELNETTKNQLIGAVDIFLDVHSDPLVKHACIESNKKGYGEAVKTRLAVEYILEKKIEFDRFFKISGRYWLNEKFSIESYSKTQYTFMPINNGENYLTVLYSVPFSLLDDFYKAVCACCNSYINNNISLETILPSQCAKPFHILKPLGVSGYIAVDVNGYVDT